MNGWAIIAVNARARCKTRLDALLGPAGRMQLARSMLRHVLRTVAETRGLGRVAVVSPERDQVPAGTLVIHDDGHGLDAAADAARRYALRAGAAELLLVAADLPHLTAAELESLLAVGRRTGFALATDRAGRGTNALYLGDTRCFRFAFGPDSRAAHCREARRLGLDPVVVQTPGLAGDVDTCDDYRDAWADRVSVHEGLALPVAG